RRSPERYVQRHILPSHEPHFSWSGYTDRHRFCFLSIYDSQKHSKGSLFCRWVWGSQEKGRLCMRTAKELENLSAREPDSGLVRFVVDTPKGSRNKYKYDETLGLYRLSKVLPLGSAFPYDFGSIPSTRAEDGDPMDVLLLGEEALFPGCLVTVRLVGVIQAE